jgi:hypothetical protein
MIASHLIWTASIEQSVCLCGGLILQSQEENFLINKINSNKCFVISKVRHSVGLCNIATTVYLT